MRIFVIKAVYHNDDLKIPKGADQQIRNKIDDVLREFFGELAGDYFTSFYEQLGEAELAVVEDRIPCAEYKEGFDHAMTRQAGYILRDNCNPKYAEGYASGILLRLVSKDDMIC